jgi:hypothetical protein
MFFILIFSGNVFKLEIEIEYFRYLRKLKIKRKIKRNSTLFNLILKSLFNICFVFFVLIEQNKYKSSKLISFV